MTTIMISIMPEGIPVDKMDGGDDGSSCPIATHDEEVNDVNKMYAHDEADYRDVEGNSSSDRCGTCAAYNQTEDMLDCIDDESGSSGYCQIYKFVCSDDYVCDEWVKGGPITGDAAGSERDFL